MVIPPSNPLQHFRDMNIADSHPLEFFQDFYGLPPVSNGTDGLLHSLPQMSQKKLKPKPFAPNGLPSYLSAVYSYLSILAVFFGLPSYNFFSFGDLARFLLRKSCRWEMRKGKPGLSVLKHTRLCVIVYIVRIFKNTWFTRFAGKEGITDGELVEAVNRLESGQAVDLGGGVYKMRVARPGESKAGGYRVIVFYKIKERTFFRYGFAKSAIANISKKELNIMKKYAKKFFAQSDEQINMQLANGTLLEIT
jgi:hypothetical protein